MMIVLLYQLLFYFTETKARVGALVFPSKVDSEPIRVTFSSNDFCVFIIGLNMQKEINLRNNKLSNDVELLLSYI